MANNNKIILNGKTYGVTQIYEVAPPAPFYHVYGRLIKGESDSVAATGCADIVLNNGIATINFDLQFTTTGSSSTNWGINTDLIRNLNSNIPAITPIAGGNWNSYESTYGCDLLYENTDFTVASGTADVQHTYTLNADIFNYDALLIMAWVHDTGQNSKDQLSSLLVPKSEYAISIAYTSPWNYMMNGSIGSSVRRFLFTFDSSTVIRTMGNRTSSEEPKLYKVYGLNFSNIINFSSFGIHEVDSTNLGYWTPGKYTQNTFNLLPSNSFNTGAFMKGVCYGTYDLGDYNRGRIINGDSLSY